MPATNPGRILTGQSMEDLNMVSSFSLPQSVLGSILPSILTSSDLVLTYDLNDSEFYASFVEASFSLNFYLFGLIVTILLFLYGFCRATCLSLYGRNMEIAGHIFSVKTLSMVVYPTYAEYVNFCLGFMTSDLPWLNSKLPSSFFSISDLKPMGFSFYFFNMNLAAMNLSPVSSSSSCSSSATVCCRRPRPHRSASKAKRATPKTTNLRPSKSF